MGLDESDVMGINHLQIITLFSLHSFHNLIVYLYTIILLFKINNTIEVCKWF